VCGNSWRMLAETRFAPYFDFVGDFSTHYGIFAGCGTSLPFDESAPAQGGKAKSSCC
jgi:arsenite methyltransferase